MGSLCNYGGLSNVEGDVNEIVKKSDKFKYKKQNNNFARASRFIVHFFAVTARLRRESAQFHVLWSKWTQDGDFLFLFLYFNTFFMISAPE